MRETYEERLIRAGARRARLQQAGPEEVVRGNTDAESATAAGGNNPDTGVWQPYGLTDFTLLGEPFRAAP